MLKNTKRTCTRPSTWRSQGGCRQLRKYKTKVVDRKLRAADETIRMAEPAAAGELDVDGLMQELAADDEVVRVKTIEFEPLTEEEALVKIDLLGHDFSPTPTATAAS